MDRISQTMAGPAFMKNKTAFRNMTPAYSVRQTKPITDADTGATFTLNQIQRILSDA